jgi:hypothetical protein
MGATILNSVLMSRLIEVGRRKFVILMQVLIDSMAVVTATELELPALVECTPSSSFHFQADRVAAGSLGSEKISSLSLEL